MLKEVSIEIIRKCPNRCLHCSSFAHKECKEIMPYDTFKDVISAAARLGAKTICLSGGEPFLHGSIVDMVKFVREHGMACYIYTSGITLNALDQPIPLPMDILKQLSGYVTKLIFNIEAGTAQTYDRIMGTRNCYEKMQTSAIHAATAGICIEAHFVPMAINIDEINAVMLLCKKLHISKLSFLRLVLHGRAEENRELLALTEEQSDALKARLHELQTEAEIAVRIGIPLSLDTSCHKCEAANGKLNIKYNGDVFPCEVFKNNNLEKSLHGLKPGNIFRQSLDKIYHDSELLNFVRELSKSFSGTCKCETCIGQHLLMLEETEEI